MKTRKSNKNPNNYSFRILSSPLELFQSSGLDEKRDILKKPTDTKNSSRFLGAEFYECETETCVKD